MTAQERPNADAIVDRLVELARDAPPEHLSAHERAGVHRIEQALLVRRRRGRALRIAGATALAAAALVLVLVPRLRDRPLTYEVANATISEGGYVATTDAEASLRFSDDSALEVARATRVRVSALVVHGARVLLEDGMLHARIHPAPRASWTLDAGPYVVHVTGTEFDLAWRAQDQTLDLRLIKGSVVVDGPLADAGVRVGAGQHLIANGRAGTLSLVDERNGHAAPGEAPSTIADAVPSESPAHPVAAPPLDAPGAGRSRPRVDAPSWKGRVAHGDFDGVVADAERMGLDKALAESTAADLAALADAARYARRQDLARRALLASRSRYPGSMPARDASFFLGGLAEGNGAAAERDEGAALDWYDVYLREDPHGAYASQALGRKMMLVQHRQGLDSARSIASEYLARFPDGPYAVAANKLLRSQ
jgi:hypothetical protein